MKKKMVMSKQDKLNIDLNDNRNVYQNTAQDYVVTTKDKLELVLLKTEKRLSSKNAWMTPLGLVLSCTLSLLSSNFKDFILPANVWYAIFIITTIICFFWLCYTIYLLIVNWNKGNIDNIIKNIIKESGK